MSLLFKKICRNKEMLAKHTHTDIHVYPCENTGCPKKMYTHFK